MTSKERNKSTELIDALSIDIVSYYREPTDSKMHSVLLGAIHLRRIEGDERYKACVDQICVRILYICDHAFVGHIKQSLLTLKIKHHGI